MLETPPDQQGCRVRVDLGHSEAGPGCEMPREVFGVPGSFVVLPGLSWGKRGALGWGREGGMLQSSWGTRYLGARGAGQPSREQGASAS